MKKNPIKNYNLFPPTSVRSKCDGNVQGPTPGQLRKLPQPLVDLLLVLHIDWSRFVLRFSFFSLLLKIKSKLGKFFGFPVNFFLSARQTVSKY